jgi:hypothetical protein
MDLFYIISIILTVSVLLIVSGKTIDFENGVFRQNSIQTKGVIVKNKSCLGRITVIRPVVQFTTHNGEVVQALDESSSALAIPRFSEGQQIVLIYNKENPYDFRIVSNGHFA